MAPYKTCPKSNYSHNLNIHFIQWYSFIFRYKKPDPDNCKYFCQIL